MRHDNWTFNYSPPFGDYNYHYYFTHPLSYLTCLGRKLKWFYQRGRYGYADRDVWSVDWYLTSFMGKALRQLSTQVHGVPIIDTGRVITDPNDCDCLTMEEWKFTINYIAETFDIARKIEEYDIIGVKEMEIAMKRFKHGMDMFNEYFFSLWD